MQTLRSLELPGALPLSPHQGSAPEPLGRLQRPQDPQLDFAMAYGHCISSLQHDNQSWKITPQKITVHPIPKMKHPRTLKTFRACVTGGIIFYCTNANSVNKTLSYVKSVQSALSDLLTTSATHGTFSRPSTKRGLISIIELMQFTIVRFFKASLGKLCFRKRAIKMLLSNEKPIIALGL